MKCIIECTYYDEHLEFEDKAEYQDFLTVDNPEIVEDLLFLLNDDQFRDCFFRLKQN